MNFDTQLQHNTIKLELLNKSHAEALIHLATNKVIWDHATEQFYPPEIFEEKWLKKAYLQTTTNERTCFIIKKDNQIAGSSSYYDIDTENKRLNIGYTWFDSNLWGTTINAISKLILIDHVFYSLKFNRVGFSVDSKNERSCNALKKLGIKQEGILRNHMVLPNGRIRHSSIFSVICDEWPEVREIILNKIESSCR